MLAPAFVVALVAVAALIAILTAYPSAAVLFCALPAAYVAAVIRGQIQERNLTNAVHIGRILADYARSEAEKPTPPARSDWKDDGQ